MVLLENPPKLVYDNHGRLIEVIVQAEDYLAYLRAIAVEAGDQPLPAPWQETIDRLRLLSDEDHLRTAAEAMLADYESDPELTAFTALDSEDFYA